MLSESGCQSISFPAPEEDTSTSSVTCLRSTMTQERLSNLALLYIEKDVSSQLWNLLDSLILQFAEKHKNSRLVLWGQCTNRITGSPGSPIFERTLAHKKIVMRARMQHMCDDLEGDLL